jgi:hypothetical protein
VSCSNTGDCPGTFAPALRFLTQSPLSQSIQMRSTVQSTVTLPRRPGSHRLPMFGGSPINHPATARSSGSCRRPKAGLQQLPALLVSICRVLLQPRLIGRERLCLSSSNGRLRSSLSPHRSSQPTNHISLSRSSPHAIVHRHPLAAHFRRTSETSGLHLATVLSTVSAVRMQEYQ